MHIDYNILMTYGAVARKLEKGAILFHEGGMPNFYYQLVEGAVKLFSTNTEGRELIQGVFSEGQSFGEPPLLLHKCYPSTAQAVTACVVLRISKEKFLHILKDFPEIMERMLHLFAQRIYQKATAAQIWVSHTPEEKIIRFLQVRKTEGGCKPADLWAVPHTRQQIADFTGLRVETVIRTLSKMSNEGKVKIIDHKLYY